jgi:hypothetical protein
MRNQSPIVQHFDDERSSGNGIIIMLREGYNFYDDCGTMGFDTIREANAEIKKVEKRYA